MRNWFFQHWKNALTLGLSTVITLASTVLVIIRATSTQLYDMVILLVPISISLLSLFTSLVQKSSKHSFDIIVFDCDEIITQRLFKKKVYKWDDVMEVGLQLMDLSEGAENKSKEKLTISVMDADSNHDTIYMDNRRAIKEVIGEHYNLDGIDLEKIKNSIL